MSPLHHAAEQPAGLRPLPTTPLPGVPAPRRTPSGARPATARAGATPAARAGARGDRRSVHLVGVVLCALVVVGARAGVGADWATAAAGPLAALAVLWCRWAGVVGDRSAAPRTAARVALAVAVPGVVTGGGLVPALLAGVAVAGCGLLTAESHRVLGRAVDARRGRAVRRTRSRHPLATPPDLAVLVAAAAVGSAGSLLPGALLLAGGGAPALLDAGAWALRTSSCVLAVVGAALVVTAPGAGVRRRVLVRRAPGDAPAGVDGAAHAPVAHPLEVALLVVAATSVHVLLWGVLQGAPLAFAALPLSVWVALRASTATTALHVVVVGLVVTACAVAGRGPVAGLGEAGPLVAHAFAAVLAVVCLALSLYRHQRDDLLGHLDRTRRAADERADLLRLSFATAPTGMAVVGLEGGRAGVVTEANAALAALVGRPARTLAGRRLDELVGPHEGDGPCALGGGSPRARGAAAPRCEHAVVGDGERRGRLGASRVHPEGRAPYLLVVVEDVTAERRLERALRHRASHDPLTDLPRRELLVRRADAAAGRAGLLFLDLDGFKPVNDSAGHAAGDELLRHVARRLVVTAGPDALVARVGGDEFAVLVPTPDGASPAALSALGRRLVAALEVPVILDSGVFSVSASVGGRTGAPGLGSAGLLHDADLAMYAAKRAGRGRVVLHGDVLAR